MYEYFTFIIIIIIIEYILFCIMVMSRVVNHKFDS